MPKPTYYDWATDLNISNSAHPMNGQPIKVTPSNGQRAAGFMSQVTLMAGWLDWALHNVMTEWLGWLDVAPWDEITDCASALFGDGSTADPLDVADRSLTGSVYYSDWTITGCDIDTAGHLVFVNGTLTLDAATLGRPGLAGGNDGGAVGAALAAAALGAAGAGGSGTLAGSGIAGGSLTQCAAGFSPGGGVGGNAGGNTGGNGGTATVITAASGAVRSALAAQCGHVIGAAGVLALRGGCGGGGGAGTTGTGGSGGSGGGVGVIWARRIVLVNNSVIDFRGGAGGACTSGVGGGGGGGQGGLLWLGYGSLDIEAGSSVSVAGGAGGAASGAGVAGGNGQSGTLIYCRA